MKDPPECSGIETWSVMHVNSTNPSDTEVIASKCYVGRQGNSIIHSAKGCTCLYRLIYNYTWFLGVHVSIAGSRKHGVTVDPIHIEMEDHNSTSANAGIVGRA